MKKIVRNAIGASLFLIIPAIVEACPVCAGRNGRGYIQTILLPVAVFLIAPFIVFCLVAIFIKKRLNQKAIHDETTL